MHFCLILLTARHPVYCGLDNADFYLQDIYFQAVLIIIYFLKKQVRQQALYIFSKENVLFHFIQYSRSQSSTTLTYFHFLDNSNTFTFFIPGRNRPPSWHANHETASLPHRSWNGKPDSHHPHIVHSKPPGHQRKMFGNYCIVSLKPNEFLRQLTGH